jgi:SAM-dependent methyltransferase
VDIDPGTVDRARQSGFYREVWETPAHHLPFPPDRFQSVIANCSLEHMDHLPEVLRSLYQCLAPKGTFLLSVVTDKLREWSPLPLLLELLGDPEKAKNLDRNYEAFHHYRNVFAPPVWARHLEDAGFQILDHTPIVPEMTARFFLFMDQIWHIPYLRGECGDVLISRFAEISRFPEIFRQIFSAVLQMEKNWSVCAGAIFWTQKP